MKLTVSGLSQISIYEQIKQQIKEQVFSGTLKSGEQLPSIRMLAKELKVGVITSKRAYDDLCEEGVLVSHQGKGIFVAEISTEDVKANHLQIVEDHLRDAASAAKQYGINETEVKSALEKIYKEINGNERN